MSVDVSQTLKEPWLLFLEPGLPVSKERASADGCVINVGPVLPWGGQEPGEVALPFQWLSCPSQFGWKLGVSQRPARPSEPPSWQRQRSLRPRGWGRQQYYLWFVSTVLIFRAILC